MYSHIQKRLKKCDRPERFCYGRWYSAIDQCTASRTSQGWCDDTMTKLLRALALVEVLNVVSIMCVDIGVVKGSVQSNHSVNTTLVYFNSTPTAWLSAFIHGSWLSDLFYVCLFILFPPQKKQPVRQKCYTALRYLEEFFCSLTFGYLWNTLVLVFRSTEGEKKEQNAYNKTEKLLMN